ncbi:MAG: DNA alkylation repair protein [Siphonobacter sp.]
MSLPSIIALLQSQTDKKRSVGMARYFKTGPGEYGEHDIFLGLSVGQVRVAAKQFRTLSLEDVVTLLRSPVHEHRSAALFIWVDQYKKGDLSKKLEIFEAYLAHREHINNWDLVDVSARDIVGAFLYDQDRRLLYDFARSEHLWTNRIAMIATQYFIRKKDYTDALAIAEIFLTHRHDLIHKASGWMLREIGKQDVEVLKEFLNEHTPRMPRTMLRYAIEKFPESERQYYLKFR